MKERKREKKQKLFFFICFFLYNSTYYLYLNKKYIFHFTCTQTNEPLFFKYLDYYKAKILFSIVLFLSNKYQQQRDRKNGRKQQLNCADNSTKAS